MLHNFTNLFEKKKVELNFDNAALASYLHWLELSELKESDYDYINGDYCGLCYLSNKIKDKDNLNLHGGQCICILGINSSCCKEWRIAEKYLYDWCIVSGAIKEKINADKFREAAKLMAKHIARKYLTARKNRKWKEYNSLLKEGKTKKCK